MEKQVEILAMFFANQFDQENPHIEALFELKELWYQVYSENRKHSFQSAAVAANKAVIEKIFQL